MQHFHHVHRGSPTRFFALLRSLAVLSEEELATVIAMGGAYLGKRRCKSPDRIVRTGQSVSLFFRRPIVMEPVAFDPAWILADHDAYLVAAKPSGVPTQGTRDADYHCFYELLKSHCSGYLGLHHRLDQETSGLLLFSRDRCVNADMARLFRERRISKTYLALCRGTWSESSNDQRIDAALTRVTTDQGSFQRVLASGRSAQTLVSRIASDGDTHLVAAQPITGRTHQIRVHLAHIQLPVLGDLRYGGAPPGPVRLHCARLAWPDLGKLPGGTFQQAPPQPWWQTVSPKLIDAFRDWWNPCPEP